MPTNASTAPILLTNGANNGKPVVNFNGTNIQFLQVTGDNNMSFTTNSMSTFYVALFSNYTTYREVWSKVAANGYAAPVDQFCYSASGLAYTAVGNGAGAKENLLTGPTVPAGTFCAMGFTVNGPRDTNYFNYTIAASGALTTVYPPVDGGFPLRIGRRLDNVVIMDGDIAEILIYNRPVSDGERVQILNYLLSKWGIPLVQAATAPPVVTLSTPTNGMKIAAPGLLSLVASATEPANAISQVNFLANGIVVASLTAPPYQIPLEVLTPGTVTVQATAMDYFGAVGQSAPVTVTVTGSVQSPPPPPTNGLAIWLEADTGVVTNLDGTVLSWADQTTNGNNAVEPNDPGAPMLIMDTNINRPVLAFNGNTTPQSLQVPYSPTEDCSLDMSMFYTVNFAPFQGVNTICSETSPGLIYQFDYSVSVAGAAMTRSANPYYTAYSTGPFPAGQYLVGGVAVSGDGCYHYLNGTSYGTGIVIPPTDMQLPMEIGMRGDSLNPLTGNLGDLLVYDRYLGPNEAQTVSTYLAARYGVAFTQLSTQAPALNVALTGTNVQLSWPPGYAGYVLQSSTNLTTSAWTPLATNPVNNQVRVTANKAAQFFRLMQGH